ncbi:hypothetical protein RCH06_003588 [Polaromonas sp. CG_9.5]|uniref:hypothetical protein n=1 Tax=Polaromonas sp. CG_9.5 TaxID=3071705 RepID=UPI002DFCC15A|nr:hypothetical protein [Polaromonas sp. CG_9.5]
MIVVNNSAQYPASVQCNVEIQLQIAVHTADSSSTERSHTERLEIQRQVDYAWAAGFLDGEGCVTLVRVRRTCGNRTNYRARVHVVQNCLETLNAFRDRVGENSVLAQLTHRDSYTRPIYQLIYDGIHCHRLLKKLRPHLVRKGAEADVIFEFYRDGEPTRHFGPKGVPAEIWHLRERCYDALRCLK